MSSCIRVVSKYRKFAHFQRSLLSRLASRALPYRTAQHYDSKPPASAEVYSSHDCQSNVQLFRCSFWMWHQSKFPASFVKVSRLRLRNHRAIPRYSSVRHILRLHNGNDTKAPWPTTCSCCKSLTSLVHGNECQCRHALSRSTVAVERHRFGSH